MKNESEKKTENWTDRRECERLKAKDGGIVLCKQEPLILGTLLDISKSGLSFLYEKKKDEHFYATELTLLFAPDIFLSIENFKSVYDFEIPNEAKSNYSNIRRHSIKLGKLDIIKIEQLEYVIRFYTLREDNIIFIRSKFD